VKGVATYTHRWKRRRIVERVGSRLAVVAAADACHACLLSEPAMEHNRGWRFSNWEVRVEGRNRGRVLAGGDEILSVLIFLFLAAHAGSFHLYGRLISCREFFYLHRRSARWGWLRKNGQFSQSSRTWAEVLRESLGPQSTWATNQPISWLLWI
jgi:hypothetical protein